MAEAVEQNVPAETRSLWDSIKPYLEKESLAAFALGVSSGFPFAMIAATLPSLPRASTWTLLTVARVRVPLSQSTLARKKTSLPPVPSIVVRRNFRTASGNHSSTSLVSITAEHHQHAGEAAPKTGEAHATARPAGLRTTQWKALFTLDGAGSPRAPPFKDP